MLGTLYEISAERRILMNKDIINPLLIFLFGAIVNHLWNNYRNSLIKLKYTVWHLYLGASIEDTPFGKLEMSYNGNPVESLYMSTVVIKNDSKKDISKMELNILCDDSSNILVSQGKNTSSTKKLGFTNEYKQLIKNKEKEDTKEDTKKHKKRDYFVPVLNRGEVLEFALVVTNVEGVQPIVTVNCDHPGVKIEYKEDGPQIFGIPQKISTIFGLVLSIFISILIILYVPSKVIAVLLAITFGLFASIIGAFIIKVFKTTLKILK
jgi:hypothetical protein